MLLNCGVGKDSRVPWTARRSNQSLLKEISPEYSLEELKLQYFDHLMGRTDSLEKTLMLGKIKGRREGDDRGWDGWIASPTRWTRVWAGSRSWWCTGKPGVLQSMESQRVRQDWGTKLNWYLVLGFPGGSMVKNPPANAEDATLIPGSGRFPGGGNGNPLQYPCLENFMGRRAWLATVHGVAKRRTQLKDKIKINQQWPSAFRHS